MQYSSILNQIEENTEIFSPITTHAFRLNNLVKELHGYPKLSYMSQTIPVEKKVKKILIIEDEGDICLLLNIILKGDETDLEHVNTLAKAKEFLDNEQPDVVLLDNKLPDGLGIDFISYIRSKYPSIKIVMISGFHAATARDLALTNGADVFLEKPFTRDQLCSSIDGLTK